MRVFHQIHFNLCEIICTASFSPQNGRHQSLTIHTCSLRLGSLPELSRVHGERRAFCWRRWRQRLDLGCRWPHCWKRPDPGNSEIHPFGHASAPCGKGIQGGRDVWYPQLENCEAGIDRIVGREWLPIHYGIRGLGKFVCIYIYISRVWISLVQLQCEGEARIIELNIIQKRNKISFLSIWALQNHDPQSKTRLWQAATERGLGSPRFWGSDCTWL